MQPIPSRSAIVASLPGRGLGLAAVLPIHYPRALLRAHGLHPMEVWGPAGVDPSEGAAHFQAYTCGIVRNASTFLLRGSLDDATVLLVPHTCDALQGMGSVLKDFVDTKQKVLTFYLPRGDRPSDLTFLADELRQLGRELAEVTGNHPSADALRAAIAQDEAADAALTELALHRDDVALDDARHFAVLRAREFMLPEDFVELAASVPRGAPPTGGVPLMISGIVPEPMELFEHIAEMGARVVADDLACCSRRLYPAGESDEPYVRLAERMMHIGPDPTRGSPIRDRARFLTRRLEQSGAKGLLIYDVKFCEPELFDIPQLRRLLEADGYPVLHVEFDLAATVSQQTLTRIEAFVEMLG